MIKKAFFGRLTYRGEDGRPAVVVHKSSLLHSRQIGCERTRKTKGHQSWHTLAGDRVTPSGRQMIIIRTGERLTL